MPLTNSQYNALMRVYEEKRAKSRDLANLHYERACQKVPELASIDASISSASLDQAKKLLAGGRMTIYEVAEATGYNSSTAFGRAFKRITGMKPSEYRSTHREAGEKI